MVTICYPVTVYKSREKSGKRETVNVKRVNTKGSLRLKAQTALVH
jgi:hypothetical protein